MAKQNNRLRYSNGGLHLQKKFKNVDASLSHHQTQSNVSTTGTLAGPKTKISVTRERYEGGPSTKSFNVERDLGRGFKATFKKQGKNKSYGLQYTKSFGKK